MPESFLFEADEQGGIAVLELPGVLTGSWGRPDEVWLKYRFEEEISGDTSTSFSSRDMDFAGTMTSDTTAEGRFDLTKRDYYILYGLPHYFGTFVTVRRGRWSARAVAFPTAAFASSRTEISVQGQVILDASASYDPDGNIVSYDWDFGDGFAAQGEGVDHIYVKPGEYTVILTVTDNDELQDQAMQGVKVWPGATVSLLEGAVTITWYGEAGRFYQVYCCQDLSAGEWIGLGDPVPGANAPMSLSDPQAASARRCFYRVVSLP